MREALRHQIWEVLNEKINWKTQVPTRKINHHPRNPYQCGNCDLSDWYFRSFTCDVEDSWTLNHKKSSFTRFKNLEVEIFRHDVNWQAIIFNMVYSPLGFLFFESASWLTKTAFSLDRRAQILTSDQDWVSLQLKLNDLNILAKKTGKLKRKEKKLKQIQSKGPLSPPTPPKKNKNKNKTK